MIVWSTATPTGPAPALVDGEDPLNPPSPNNPQAAISIQNLTKVYGSLKAVDELTLASAGSVSVSSDLTVPASRRRSR